MNCLESRRSLLASPRSRTAEHETHIAQCESCARLLSELAELDRRIGKAVHVPAPEALAHRVLLTRPARPSWHYAAAAAFAVMCILLGLIAIDVVHAPGYVRTAEAVGPAHPAIAAIAQVLDEELEHPYASGNHGPAEVEERLKRLGLALQKGKATAYYVGKCHLAGDGECDQIVLSTPDAYANVMLVPDYPLPDRLLVANRRMIAFVNPAPQGGYIVVADSAKVAKRMQKFFIKG